MIILHATASGNPALRDPNTGSSFFITELCEQLKKPERRTIVQESFTHIDNLQLRLVLRTFFDGYLAIEHFFMFETFKIMMAITENLSTSIHKIIIDGEEQDFQMVPQYSSCLRDDLVFFENKPDKSAIAG